MLKLWFSWHIIFNKGTSNGFVMSSLKEWIQCVPALSNDKNNNLKYLIEFGSESFNNDTMIEFSVWWSLNVLSLLRNTPKLNTSWSEKKANKQITRMKYNICRVEVEIHIYIYIDIHSIPQIFFQQSTIYVPSS